MTVRFTALTLAVGAVFSCACAEIEPDVEHAWARQPTAWAVPFEHENGATGKFHLPEIMGGGVALLDADGDGDADLYLTNGNLDPETGSVNPTGPRNAFFRNEGGRFVEATEQSGLGDRGYGMGVAVGDVDNDGDLDVYVANFGTDRLYRNDGGVFSDATAHAGLDVDGWSASATFVDYDRDGWLDLFVTRYVRYRGAKSCTDAAGREDYCGPSVFAPEPDVLLRNRGDGTFEDVSVRSGIARGIGRGLGVVAFDANDDRRVDFYVANDGDANQLWIQQDDGIFVDEALLRGVAYNHAGETEAGMGVIAEDFDDDGGWDLFVTHLAEETNTLYRPDGETYRDRSEASGLGRDSRPLTGFGTAALDLDRDGALDLIVANGRVSGGFEGSAPLSSDRFSEPNRLYRGLGNGRFASLDWVSEGVSRGVATADLDHDGDDDWVVANSGGFPEVWINQFPTPGNWLAVRAQLAGTGRDAVGAVVTLTVQSRRMVRRIDRGGGYLSSKEPVARFGLGVDTHPTGLTIRWPDGVEETFDVGEVNRVLELTRGEGHRP